MSLTRENATALLRWRLVLGSEAERAVPQMGLTELLGDPVLDLEALGIGTGEVEDLDDTLDFVYGPQRSKGLTTYIPKWLERVRQFFTADVHERIQRRLELQRQHDPMGQLDVMQDPGVALGTLRINSRPWSQVFIDNKPVGTTPLLNVSVSAGQHSIRLVNNVFGMRKTFDVNVGAGENISQVVSLGD